VVYGFIAEKLVVVVEDTLELNNLPLENWFVENEEESGY